MIAATSTRPEIRAYIRERLDEQRLPHRGLLTDETLDAYIERAVLRVLSVRWRQGIDSRLIAARALHEILAAYHEPPAPIMTPR